MKVRKLVKKKPVVVVHLDGRQKWTANRPGRYDIVAGPPCGLGTKHLAPCGTSDNLFANIAPMGENPYAQGSTLADGRNHEG